MVREEHRPDQWASVRTCSKPLAGRVRERGLSVMRGARSKNIFSHRRGARRLGRADDHDFPVTVLKLAAGELQDTAAHRAATIESPQSLVLLPKRSIRAASLYQGVPEPCGIGTRRFGCKTTMASHAGTCRESCRPSRFDNTHNAWRAMRSRWRMGKTARLQNVCRTARG